MPVQKGQEETEPTLPPVPGAAAVARPGAEVYAHKLYAPPGYREAIARTALLERAFGDRARLVVLQGPAGHGKTTTLQQLKALAESAGHTTGWLSFDEADNDSRRFSVHLQALITQVVGAAPMPLPADEDDAPLPRYKSDWLIDRLLRADRPIALFFDEFQALGNRVLLNFCRELFERIPAQVRLFIGSRSLPEIGLARMIVNNQALVLRADHLRFSRAEVDSFFAAHREVELSAAEIETIYQLTEGWPAAVQLFRLSLGSPEVRGALGDLGRRRPRELAEYLTDSVLALQPPRIQEFLLQTSLLTRLSAPLCEAVTGWPDAQELLLQLERSGLFLRSLDSELRWFRYHGLFSDFLAEQVRQRSPGLAVEVHRRAAAWHRQHGDEEDTIHHAIACGDFALAADTLNIWAARLVGCGALITLERWFERLPFAEVAARVDLSIKVAYALVFLRRHARLRELQQLLQPRRGSGGAGAPDIVLSMAAIAADDTARAFDIVDGAQLQAPENDGFAAFELGAASNLLAYRSITVADFSRAREQLDDARRCNERARATFSQGYTLGLSGVAALLQGRLDEALRGFRDDLDDSYVELGKSFSSAALASCYVWGLYEAGELQRAIALFGRHHDIIAESALPDFIAVAYLAAARACDALGDAGRARELREEAVAICAANDWPRMGALLGWERVRHAAAAGEPRRARQLAESLPVSTLPAPWLPFSEEFEGERLGRLRLEVLDGDVDGAARLLEQETQRSPRRHYRRIKLHLLEAALRERCGQHKAALRALDEALRLAQDGGLLRIFADELPAVRQLLAERDREAGDAQPPDPAFVAAVRAACGIADSAAARVPASPIEPLTGRERQILVCLAGGVPNREIAARVFVSENTVKFHLKNIYAKLDVGSRLQAIAAARRFGLVD